MSQLTTLILCGRSARHVHVANRLSAHSQVLAIVQENGSDLSLKKVQQWLKPGVLRQKVSRWLRDRKRYRGNPEARFFFGDQPVRLDREDLRIEVPHINDPKVVELANRLKPDLILVFGTSLIRGPLLEAGRLGMVNLHGGLSPEYRGADCTFWALYNREPDKVGCTLHFINAGIDTGDLIAHICPPVTAQDDELTLFWRGVKASAEVYCELLDRLERGEKPGVKQAGKGRLYQVKQRQSRHEAELAQAMRAGLLDGIDLPLRVRWFFKDEQVPG
ncbi:MAG TPA: formyl transferase [Pseudomonadales bacterium]|jgi:folate-dependent phosphoribosylglycinamide formyltransferase PurN|nr:hypothetical protein [Pseudomonadales bacterium]MCP5333632.1 formyl transferase [Pseudomonadales bacterium]HMZ90711.1 formyl transferase [Pseudomonadales bacterium]